MIGRIELWFRLARRALSRGEWAVRLLGLPRIEGAAAHPGLVLVQVDGLSFRRLQRALREGRMPFLSRLVGREGYRAQALCSGVPSSTPAVQAELFYGARTAVPAFEYFDRGAGRTGQQRVPHSTLQRTIWKRHCQPPGDCAVPAAAPGCHPPEDRRAAAVALTTLLEFSIRARAGRVLRNS